MYIDNSTVKKLAELNSGITAILESLKSSTDNIILSAYSPAFPKIKITERGRNLANVKHFVNQMQKPCESVERLYCISAAALLAQAALETGWGKKVTRGLPVQDNNIVSSEKVESYNLFNIKGKGPLGSVRLRVPEYIKGKWIKVDADFRRYRNFDEAFEDYVSLIAKKSRYNEAWASRFNYWKYPEKLQKCGYATDPEYAKKIQNVMIRYLGIPRGN